LASEAIVGARHCEGVGQSITKRAACHAVCCCKSICGRVTSPRFVNSVFW
jgi:hypothetical protein